MADANKKPDEPSPDGAAAAPRKRLSGRAKLILIIVVIAALVAALAWFVRYRTHDRYIESTNNAYLQADRVAVAPKVAGYVRRVLVAENAMVVAGQPLVEIDPAALEAAVESAEGEVRAREADLARLAASEQVQNAQVSAQSAQAELREVELAQSEREAVRQTALAKAGAGTDKARDDAVAARDRARAGVRAAEASTEATRRELRGLAAQREQALAALASARAALRARQLDLAGATISASQAGRIGDRTVVVGQYVQPGTRLMSLVAMDTLHLAANFKETQVGAMRVGQPVEVRIDAFPGQVIQGTIESFAPGTGAQFALLPPENATGNFTKVVQRVPVRIRLDASPDIASRLLPGMSAEVSVDTKAEAQRQAEARR